MHDIFSSQMACGSLVIIILEWYWAYWPGGGGGGGGGRGDRGEVGHGENWDTRVS